ncbi:aminotransferase class I and II [Ignisphaera aggregans DSM 17230]|uniref:Aminotransferase n=1 Tax=Ignisphaera aggregans (strain DSM 17230 / JCM 13409 / AQ1.S1) TaxID=583356 RepID=E0SR25_IGNAA|nr:aminotransferase class I and II [Ignisphaera aggregans DSM 17230]
MYRYHGGRVARDIIDFSVPINPLGPPKHVIDILRDVIENNVSIIAKYPDYEYNDLRKAIAEFYGVKSEYIVPLNGAAEALYIALAVYRPRNLIVIEPTFGDYRATSYALEIPLISIQYIENPDTFIFPLELLLSIPRDIARKSIILLSNPNNPTGCFISIKHIEEIVKTFRESLILIDEAFIDLSEKFQENTLHLVEEYDNIVVIRSLTKSFSVPGLRIGFMYVCDRFSNIFDLYRQPWNVNALANYLFIELFSRFGDDTRRFLEISRQYISSERSRIIQHLRRLGFTVYNSYAPYILVRSHRYSAEEINNMLLRYGIYVRDTSSYTPLTKYFFRVAIRGKHDNDYFIEIMNRVFGEEGEAVKRY